PPGLLRPPSNVSRLLPSHLAPLYSMVRARRGSRLAKGSLGLYASEVVMGVPSFIGNAATNSCVGLVRPSPPICVPKPYGPLAFSTLRLFPHCLKKSIS